VAIEQDDDFLEFLVDKPSYKSRVQYLIEVEGLEISDLLEYFHVDPKTFYDIRTGKTKSPREPFPTKLKSLESKLKSKREEIGKDKAIEKDSGVGLIRRNQTEKYLYYLSVMLYQAPESKQRIILRFAYDTVYLKRDGNIKEEIMRELNIK